MTFCLFGGVLVLILTAVNTFELSYSKSSLTFVIDVTHSMKHVKRQVENNAHAIFDAVVDSNDSYIDNFILVTFADPDLEPRNIVNVTKTKNRDEFKKSLALTLVGGDDCPEYSMSGIRKGIEESNYASSIYIFTDASAKDFEEYDNIKDLALMKQIQLVFLLTGKCKIEDAPYEGYAVYETLATETSGQVFNLHRPEINKVLEYIKASLTSRRILFAVLPFGINDVLTFNYTTDHATSDTMIAVSCNASFNIAGPDNASVELTKLVDLRRMTVVKVNETNFGIHTVTVNCLYGTSNVSRLAATAKSKIQFTYGFFSVSPNETTSEPIPSGKTNLLIQVTGNFKAEIVHLLDVSGSLIPGYILPLSPLNDTSKLFVTEPFETPNVMFRIVVFGVNMDYNETISRTAVYLVKSQNLLLEKPKIAATSNKLDTPENSNITLDCRIEAGTPEPTVKWFYNDTSTGDFDEIVESRDQQELNLSNVHRNVSGTYKCVAQNVVNNDTMAFTLVVQYAPTVSVDSKPITVKASTQATLACTADGVPDPVVAWRKNGKDLTGSKFVASSDHRLEFVSDLEDSGDYECYASNVIGFDNKTILVEVIKKPAVLINESDPIDAEYDESLSITCEVFGYPKPDIVWTDITNAVYLNADVEQKSPSHFISHLKIDKVIANATYQCRANNTLGDGKHEVSVETVRKPHFKILYSPKDEIYDVTYDTTTLFRCEADAYPTAEVKWYKNGNSLPQGQIPVSSDGYELEIKQMQPGDEGKYMCEVKNAYNNNTYPFEVKISGVEKPKIAATSNKRDTPENSNITLDCRIEAGTPEPTVKWFYNDTSTGDFDEIVESRDQQELNLSNVHRNVSGTYKCVAQNVVNNDTMAFTLVVQYAPTVSVDSKPITVKASTQATLACTADGVPDPVVAWRKDGKDLTGSKFVASSDHRLEFVADLEDSGDYECYASNVIGFDNKTILVEVIKKPAVLINESDPIDAEYDESLSITCEVFGYPKPDIVWTDITNAVYLNADVEQKSPSHFISHLKIDKVIANATYQCRANNTLGDGKHEVSVETVRKPHFKILYSPKDEIYDVTYDTTTLFRCEADAYPTAEVKWYKNGNSLPQGQIPVSSDGYELEIKQMQPGDEGKYMCEVKNAYNNNTYPFEVKISGVEKPKIAATSNKRDTPENSNITLDCRIEAGTPEPTVKWFYNDTSTGDFDEIVESRDQQELNLSNVHRNVSGTYKCVAQNVVNNDTMAFTLVVQYAPTVSVDSKPITVKASTQATLACTADGVPDPVVAWRKDGKDLTGSKFVASSDHRLEFVADLEDSGDYECYASNVIGFDNKTILVEVIKKPTVLINESDPIDAEYDEFLSITCEVFGYPKPDIVWTDITNAVYLNADVEQKSPSHFISHLKIDKVIANATYQCRANNTLGDGKHEVSVETVRKPHFKILYSPKDEIYDVTYDTTTLFRCEADAYPTAEVKWYKNGNSLPQGQIPVSSDGYELEIKQMQPGDEGKYMCEVKNAYNNNTYPFEVKISGVAKPKIIATLEPVLVSENSNAKINCRIERGKPFPKIQWYYKDINTNMFIVIENATQEDLLLMNVQRKDRGTYKCLANNIMGNDVMESKLIVEYAPTIENDYENITEMANNSVVLKCLVDAFPSVNVEWKRDDKPLTDSKYVLNSGHDLTFKPDLDDRGIYKCIATNRLGTATKTVNVEVEKQPTVTIEGNPMQRVDYGDELHLKCNVIGNPTPHIWWTDISNGIELSSSTTIVKFPNEYLSLLIINKAVTSTTYQCEAKNIHGQDKASVNVQAVRKKHFDVIEKPKDTVIAYNTEGKLFCKIDAYPKAKIVWIHRFIEKQTISKTTDGYKISDDESTLTITNMQPKQEGKYICKASNSDNTLSNFANVTISGVEKPTLTATKNYTVREGSSITLHCDLRTGIPEPTLIWFTQDKHSNKFVEIRKARNRKTLLIVNARRDINQYACKVRNAYGKDIAKMHIQVEYPPTISDVKTVYNVSKDDMVDIPCSVNGLPTPTVEWSKISSTSTFSSENDHSLRLMTSLKDAGTYVCTATNEHGTATRTVHINVYAIEIDSVRKTTREVKESDNLKLKCDAYGYPKPKIDWFFQGTTENPKNVLVKMPLTDIKYDQRGNYTCVASNDMGGRATLTYYVDVYTEVEIHNKNDKVLAVEGDLAITLFCNATGNPKPSYKWTVDGATDEEKSDTISISPVNTGSRDVICQASIENDVMESFKTFKFDVKISEYPWLNNPNTTIRVKSGNRQPITCPMPHSTSDYVRWYKNARPVTDLQIIKDQIIIPNVKSTDAGIYTCRISSKTKSESANVILDVESMLKFVNPSVETSLSLRFEKEVYLDCSALGNPKPKISWTFNGAIISTFNFLKLKMKKAKEGKYKCIASNIHDTISRTFDVKLDDCALKIDPNVVRQPLIITQQFSLPSYKYDDGILYMPKYQSVLLGCPETGNLTIYKYNNYYANAYCISDNAGNSQLDIDGTSYDYSVIQCTQKMEPKMKWTGTPCLGSDSELVKVVYEALYKTIEIYEICMDISLDTPFYAKHKMNLPISETVPRNVPWFNDKLKQDFEKFYEVNGQLDSMKSILGRSLDKRDDCVFSKRQLVNPLDVFPGLPQRATFTYLNVVPHWSSCSAQNWEEIESRVRNLARSKNMKLTVWTGAATGLKMKNRFKDWVDIYLLNRDDGSSQAVSTYLWKVVQDSESKSSLAIIHLNIPDLLSKDINKFVSCEDICNKIQWLKGNKWSNTARGYVFCCRLSDFKKSFNYNSQIFGNYMDNVLR